MERRDAVKYTLLLMGATASSSLVSVIMSGCKVDESPDWIPSFFTPEEANFLSELSETMLPRTHTPGAKDAMVERYLDTIRPLRYTAEENEQFKLDLHLLMLSAKKDLGKDFVDANPEQRLKWLTETDQLWFARWNKEDDEKNRPFYLSLKELILAGYFSSEKVAKEYFTYLPIPGKREACMDYSAVGKAWAF